MYINKEAIKYISSGNPVRIKNIFFHKNKKIKFSKDQIVSIFYKNKYQYFKKGKVLATGKVKDSFYLKNDKNDNINMEKEIIKLVKIF